MRLPWPFGRRTPLDGPSPAAPEGATPSAPSTPTTATAPPTGAWTSLPPIQRTVGDAPLVAPSAPFLDEVPGHRPLPPIVQPLGHEAGPSAPPGLVLAKPTAVPALTSHAPMPVQRRAAAASPAVPETWSEPEPVAEAAEPVRHLRTVTPAATVAPSPRPLTQAPTVTTPMAQRSSAPGSRPDSPAVTPRSPGDPGTGLPAGLPAPRGAVPGRAGRWAEHAVAGAAAAGLGAPLAPIPSAAAAPTPAGTPSSPPRPGASAPGPAASAPRGVSAPGADPAAPAPAVQRRAGLGDPMTTAPATSVSRRPAMSLAPARRGLPSAAAGAPEAAPYPSGPSSAAATAEAPAARPLPVLPVSRRAGAPATAGDARHEPATSSRSAVAHPGGAAHSTTPDSSRHAERVPTGSPSRSPMPHSVRPTLGARPLRPSVSVQREAPDGTAGGPAETMTPSPVAARWPSRVDLPATVDALPPVWPADDAVPLQRLASPDHSPAPVFQPGQPGMREIVFPSPGVAAPVIADPAGGPARHAVPQRSTAPAVRPTTWQPARRASEPSLNLARASAPAAAPITPPASSSPGAPVQRFVAAPPSSAGAATVQTTRPGPSTVPDISVTPVIQRIDGSAPTPQTGRPGGARSDRELDELAQALFGRLRTRLRTEVIQEREARGLGFDAF